MTIDDVLQRQPQPETVYLAIGYYSDKSGAEVLGATYSEEAAYALIGHQASEAYLGMNYRVVSLKAGERVILSVYP